MLLNVTGVNPNSREPAKRRWCWWGRGGFAVGQGHEWLLKQKLTNLGRTIHMLAVNSGVKS